MITRNLLIVASLVAFTYSSTATAASGYVRVDLGYYEHNGGFCDPTDPGRNCTGARHVSSYIQKRLPLHRIRVYLRRLDGSTLGEAVSSTAGIATIPWSTWPWEGAPTAVVEVQWEHGDGRFRVRGNESQILRGTSSSFALVDGKTESSPQNRGTLDWGNENVGNSRANLYGAAARTWTSMDDSSRLVAAFNNHEIRAFNSNGDTYCFPPQNYTRFDVGQQFNQLVVSHELAHQAEYSAGNFRAHVDYCYPYKRRTEGDACYCGDGDDPNACSSHYVDRPEHQSAVLIEGFADFIAVRAAYNANAVQPQWCFPGQAQSCPLGTGSYDLETTPLHCTLDLSRQEISAARYFWDIYDTIDDPVFIESSSVSYGAFFDTLNQWQSGDQDRQRNEPYDFYGNVDNPNGRNMQDFRYAMRYFYGGQVETSSVLGANCGGYDAPTPPEF